MSLFPATSGSMASSFSHTIGYGFSGLYDVSNYNNVSFYHAQRIQSISFFKVAKDGTISIDTQGDTTSGTYVSSLSGYDYLMIGAYTGANTVNITINFS